MTAIAYRDKNGITHNGTFSYDAGGNPLTYNNGKNSYTTLGGKIVREAYGANVVDYFYDNNGSPYKIVVKAGSANPVTGYFVLNLQGDVIGIIDGDGTAAVEYEYDAWGKEISHTTAGNHGSTLYNHNALKYRGYYYDADLGLYYLNNRFYDQEIGGFINADTIELVLASQTTLTDKNLYAYCDNNPVVRKDAGGAFWDIAIGIRPDYYDGTTIFELKPYNPRAAKAGVKQLKKYNSVLGGGKVMRMELY